MGGLGDVEPGQDRKWKGEEKKKIVRSEDEKRTLAKVVPERVKLICFRLT